MAFPLDGGQSTAMCGNPECRIMMWDRTKTLDELADNLGTVTIRETGPDGDRA
jgi:hypothetical protein